MTDNSSEPINIVVTVDISDTLLDRIRDVSPRLRVERHLNKVPDKVWASANIILGAGLLPEPEQAPHLRWIQLYSAGVDQLLDRPIIRSNDVEVTSASGVHAVQMAEFALAMILAFTYKLRHMIESQAKSEWSRGDTLGGVPDVYFPRELRGQTLGIHGYGSIGRELARQATALGLIVLATKQNLMQLADDGWREPHTGDPTGDIPARLYPSEAIASMARECDFLVLLAPLTADSRHSINEAVFNVMKPTSVLVNLARGGLVDEAALIQALTGKKIGGAALDVFETEPLPPESPLWKLSNVIISPHVAGASANYHDKLAALFTDNLQRYLMNQPLLNRVRHDSGY